MKFECEKSLLAAAIEGVSRAISNRTAIPVLEGIYLQAEGFKLTLTGYDMEMGITTTIDCNVQAPGEAVLDAKLLGSMVSRMPAGDVGIELNEEGMAIIRGGVAEFEIPALNASDYPSLPNTAAENTMTIPCSMMREMIEKTIYAVAQEDKKPAHTGELFVIEPGSLTIVALDGYRLAIIQRDVECTRDIRIIIPSKPLQELLKIMGGQDRCKPAVCGLYDQRLHNYEPADRGRIPELRERHPQRSPHNRPCGDPPLYRDDRARLARHHRAAQKPAADHLRAGQSDGALPDRTGQGCG